MYNDTNMYSYPYYANSNHPVNYPNDMARNQHENNSEILRAIHAGIKREASAIELYSRLADVAPNHTHKCAILRAREEKKVHLNQFTILYITLTGRKPMYQIDQVPIRSYGEGLQKALDTGVEGYKEYRKNGSLSHNSIVQALFLYTSAFEKENAYRIHLLNEKVIKDYGLNPFVVNIDEVTKKNNTYRTALWTGSHLQVTLMSINVGDDIGLEVHPTTDQFLRIEDGQGLVQMGDRKEQLDFEEKVYDDFAIMIPAGKWHNVINTGSKPLKIYAIYAPPEHPFGTVHETKAIAMAAE